MSKLPLEIIEREHSTESAAIVRGLVRFNNDFGGPEHWSWLTIVLKDDRRRVVAGLNCHIDWGWLFIKHLWVSDSLRRKGVGKDLLKAAEREAKRRKCRNVWLDTFSFQAPMFYKKMGYRRFGTLKNYPRGHARFFYTKSL